MPISSQNVLAAAALEPSAGPDADREGALTDAKVMLVDDEALTLEVITTFLEESGYSRFVTTADPTEAIDLLVREHPDILLLDLMMPKVSGFDIMARMQATPELRYTPVIVLTSATDAATKLRALECGATDFLAKPVDASELRLRLRNTLAFRSYQNRLANYDRVTGLPNRQLFAKHVEQALRSARRHNHSCALLHLNLDRFGQINDALGHGAGDALLRMVAQRIQTAVRESDPLGRNDDGAARPDLSRLGGDEFTVLLPRVDRAENASLVAQRVLTAVATPYQVQGREIAMSGGIGIAVYPDDGDSSDVLLQHASAAMSFAKGQGRSTYHFYSREMNARAQERFMIENDLRKAIERNELVLHFQPKVDCFSGALVGAEALVRWQHPEKGLLLPALFIQVAEACGLIGDLGEWVLREACRALSGWGRRGFARLRMAVNVSSDQFRQDRFQAVLEDTVAHSGCDPEQLVLELTEGTLMDHAGRTISTLHAIKAFGVKLSIDDFGTGYSSLSYLKRFPLDELKIDRSFIKDVTTSPSDAAIVRAIVSIAESLGLSVVAEGVETAEQLAFLKQQGCSQYQGYLFSKPIPEQDFLELAAWNTRVPTTVLA